MAKTKKPKIPKRHSLVWIKVLSNLNLIATMAISCFFMLQIFSTDVTEFTGSFSGIPESIQILLFPILLLIYIGIFLFLLIKYVVLFLPVVVLFFTGITSAICIRVTAKQGVHTYKDGIYRGSIIAAIVLQLLYAGFNVFFCLVGINFVSENLKVNNSPLERPESYILLLAISAAISVVVALLLLLDFFVGKKRLKKDGIKTDKQIAKEKKEAELQQNANPNNSNLDPTSSEYSINEINNLSSNFENSEPAAEIVVEETTNASINNEETGANSNTENN